MIFATNILLETAGAPVVYELHKIVVATMYLWNRTSNIQRELNEKPD